MSISSWDAILERKLMLSLQARMFKRDSLCSLPYKYMGVMGMNYWEFENCSRRKGFLYLPLERKTKWICEPHRKALLCLLNQLNPTLLYFLSMFGGFARNLSFEECLTFGMFVNSWVQGEKKALLLKKDHGSQGQRTVVCFIALHLPAAWPQTSY